MCLESLREKALDLCQRHGVEVLPYAGGWWLIGQGVSRVVGELAGVGASDLLPLPMAER